MPWLQHAADERPAPALRHVHGVAAADRQDRPEIAEHDQQQEGDDVVGDRMEGHRQDAGEAQRAVRAVVAGEAAQQVAEHPGRAGSRSPAAPPSTAARGRSASRPASGRPRARARSRRPPRGARRRGTARHSPPSQPVQLLQRLAHHLDRLGTGAAERVVGGDRLLDRIDRRRVRDDEGDVDADEDDQRELAETRQQVERIAVMLRLIAREPSRRRRGGGSARLRLSR